MTDAGPLAPTPAPSTPAVAEATPYPMVRVDAPYQESVSRLLLLRSYMLIPHFFMLMGVGIAQLFALVFAWWAVLFTGRFPRGLFDFSVRAQRYQTRLTAYAWGMTDEYPPFALDVPADKIQFDVEYPEQGVPRGRALIQPIMIWPRLAFVAWANAYRAFFAFYGTAWAGLLGKRFPPRNYETMIRYLRYSQRNWAFRNLMTQKYPPTYGET